MMWSGQKSRVAIAGVWFLLLSTPAAAQNEVVQTLDRVTVNSMTSFLEMNFADPERTADFVNTGILGSQFEACRMSALNGVFCLDGDVVRNWPDVDAPGLPLDVVDCLDPNLGLDTKKPDVCSALTIDSAGTVWLAGRRKANSYSLIRVVPKLENDCPEGFDTLLWTNYCADEVVGDRDLLLDINSIDADAAESFPGGPGILTLEGRQAAVFFPHSGSPTVIASGKSAWDLQGPEQPQSVGHLQLTDSTGLRNLVLAATSNGRVLAVDADGGTATQVFDIPAARAANVDQCDFNPPSYGVRASAQSGIVYVTDRQFCQVIALQATFDPDGVFSGLENAQEPVFDSGVPTEATRDLTLSTAAGPSATFPPEAPSVAPGITIDLTECAGLCPLVLGIDGIPAATLSGVQLASLESGLTLFQVRNIPDCRFVPSVCRELLGVQDLSHVVIDPQLSNNPAGQLLNVTELLPRTITDLFPAPNELPDMLISRQYRGQRDNKFLFDAFFGVTEEGVVFRDTFFGEFFVSELTGAPELGCQLNDGSLEWDVVTTVSERFETFTDPGIGSAPQHVDTLINVDCGSSRTITGRWSLKPYNLEITPCTWSDGMGDAWVSDGSCPVDSTEDDDADDAVFAKLLLKLYDDLGLALDQLACSNADGASSQPISSSDCSRLQSTWANGKDKLIKCWNATQQPKQSLLDQNCQAFLSQFSSFSSTLAGVSGGGPDPANRRGELRARVETILHVYEDRFVPSIPAAGFDEPF